MSDHLYGFGTKFYGKEEGRHRGSYTATKWFVIAHIPIVPLGSFYVRPLQNETGTISRSLPPLTEKIAWQKGHILNVYAMAAAALIALMMVTRASIHPSAAFSARIGKGETLPPSRQNLDYTRRTEAENGNPFPDTSGYIDGYVLLSNNGYGALTINNEQNTSDLYLKLYALDQLLPARVFFIKAESSFTLENLETRSYELRYQDLETGGLVKTEPLPIRGGETEADSYFSRSEVILGKIINGNLKTEAISEDEF